MPNRIIKESICTSDNLDTLTWFEEVCFYRLIVNCDDYGRMDARPAILRARLFPLKTITDKQIKDALKSLRSAGMIDLYIVDGRSFLQIRTWEAHQTIRAKKSKFPSPVDAVKEPENICMQMQADENMSEHMQEDASKCPRNPIQSVSESESNTNGGAQDKPAPRAHRFGPPTLEEVAAYCLERQNKVDAQRWLDYYEANGWKVGKNPMKDWRAAVRNWERNGFGTSKPDATGSVRPVKEVAKHHYDQRQYSEGELDALFCDIMADSGGGAGNA